MSQKRAAIAVIAALGLAGGAGALAGCGAGEGGSGPVTLRVYVSAPLHGSRAAEGQAIEDGARLALDDAGGRIGRRRIRGVYLDDSDERGWSIARTAANARRAAQDVTAIGYVGDFDSGATRVSLPITNQAEIPQVSPASTAVDLTRLPAVGDADPDRYRPSEKQTFARVVPDDEVGARAAAVWAKKLGARTFAAIGEHSDFGEISRDAFVSEARVLGMRPFSQKELEQQFEQQARHVPVGKLPGPDALYYALTSVPRPKVDPKIFIKTLASTSSAIFGPDTFLDPAFLRTAAPIQNRLRVVSPFLDPTLLPDSAEGFLRAFRSRYEHPAPPAAAYGYESMALLLDAIRRAGDDGDSRGAVTDALLATADRRSILGRYSIDGNGDTTLDSVSGYRVGDGLPVFPVKLTAPR